MVWSRLVWRQMRKARKGRRETERERGRDDRERERERERINQIGQSKKHSICLMSVIGRPP